MALQGALSDLLQQHEDLLNIATEKNRNETDQAVETVQRAFGSTTSVTTTNGCFTPGTTLLSGIPCIVTVASDVPTERPSRFKATVRYIGEVEHEEGQWVGVEVVESAIPAESLGLEWNEGCLGDGELLVALTNGW